MAIKVTNIVNIKNTVRLFDSIQEDLNRAENWYFEYAALNNDTPKPRDLFAYGGTYNSNKADYADDVIFFDSKPATAHISSSVENIIVNLIPPELTNTDITSTIISMFPTDFKAKVTVKSEVLLDLCEIGIETTETKDVDGNDAENIDVLKVSRYNKGVPGDESGNEPYATINHIKNLKVNRNGNLYTFTFDLDREYFGSEECSENKFKFTFFDISGNKLEVTTEDSYEWKVIKVEPTEDNIKHLIIEFVEVYPENRVLNNHIVGYTKVKVYNPNKELWSFIPHVELGTGSIGVIDNRTLTYDESTGTLTFIIKNINQRGSVIVDAWIDVTKESPDIAPLIKSLTFAEAILKDFIVQDEGRLYKFKPYIPKYMTDDKYGAFVMFTELFLNTSQESLNNGNAISTLEKIARINNFNDIDRIENPLIQYYQSQFNFEVKPNFNDLVTFMSHQQDIKKGQDEKKKDA